MANWREKLMYWTWAVLVSIVQCTIATAQTSVLQQKVRNIAAQAQGTVGVACSLPGTALSCDLNANTKAPMQSVFKLPLALVVLHEVEQAHLSLDQQVRYRTDDRILPQTHSPLQQKYPEANVDVPLQELLRLAVLESDNVAADILLRMIGGPKVVSDYIASLGIAGFHLEDGEHALHREQAAQYKNWFTPAAAVQLLRLISDGPPINPAHTALLLRWMEASVKSRLKTDLPVGTPVAHKAGTSGVDEGIAHATNDIGLITLPDGGHLAIAVFITDSRADEVTREKVISRIAREAYDAALRENQTSAVTTRSEWSQNVKASDIHAPTTDCTMRFPRQGGHSLP
jgi:beta-lactamase class A